MLNFVALLWWGFDISIIAFGIDEKNEWHLLPFCVVGKYYTYFITRSRLSYQKLLLSDNSHISRVMKIWCAFSRQFGGFRGKTVIHFRTIYSTRSPNVFAWFAGKYVVSIQCHFSNNIFEKALYRIYIAPLDFLVCIFIKRESSGNICLHKYFAIYVVSCRIEILLSSCRTTIILWLSLIYFLVKNLIFNNNNNASRKMLLKIGRENDKKVHSTLEKLRNIHEDHEFDSYELTIHFYYQCNGLWILVSHTAKWYNRAFYSHFYAFAMRALCNKYNYSLRSSKMCVIPNVA